MSYSVTARDLRQLLQRTIDYDDFVRTRPITAGMPATSIGYRPRRYARARARSRSHSHSRVRSSSRSRVPNRHCNRCEQLRAQCVCVGQSSTNATAPPGQSSRDTQGNRVRPRSARVYVAPRPPSGKKHRPSSAHVAFNNTHTTRPGSAKHGTHLDVNPDNMDFSGLSNMMRQITFNPGRAWKSKSPSRKEQAKSSDSLPSTDKYNEPTINEHELRKSRSSSYTKFRYPGKFHQEKYNNYLNIEENIPQCLRKFPRYINQPKRNTCSYKPNSGAVSWVNMHCIQSGSLPKQRLVNNKKATFTHTTNATFSLESNEDTPREIQGAMETYREDEHDFHNDDTGPRNGTFQYVYGGGPEVNVNDLSDTEGHRDYADVIEKADIANNNKASDAPISPRSVGEDHTNSEHIRPKSSAYFRAKNKDGDSDTDDCFGYNDDDDNFLPDVASKDGEVEDRFERPISAFGDSGEDLNDSIGLTGFRGAAKGFRAAEISDAESVPEDI